jgi:hypothetical protein
MSEKNTLAYETVDLIKKRLGLLLGARLKDKDSMDIASKRIDTLREKYGDVEDGYDSVEVIRKWRESR